MRASLRCLDAAGVDLFTTVLVPTHEQVLQAVVLCHPETAGLSFVALRLWRVAASAAGISPIGQGGRRFTGRATE